MKRDGRVNSGLQKPLEDEGSFPWEARKRGKANSGPWHRSIHCRA